MELWTKHRRILGFCLKWIVSNYIQWSIKWSNMIHKDLTQMREFEDWPFRNCFKNFRTIRNLNQDKLTKKPPSNEILRCAHAFEKSFWVSVSFSESSKTKNRSFEFFAKFFYIFVVKVRERRRVKITDIPSSVLMISFEYIGIEKQIFDTLFGVCKYFNSFIFQNFRCFQIYFRNKVTTPVEFVFKKCVSSTASVMIKYLNMSDKIAKIHNLIRPCCQFSEPEETMFTE